MLLRGADTKPAIKSLNEQIGHEMLFNYDETDNSKCQPGLNDFKVQNMNSLKSSSNHTKPSILTFLCMI